ncbi:hypothetical protein Tco_0618029 [Tanacetum coccineum]
MRRMMMMKKIDGLNNEKGKRKWQSMVLEMKIEEIVCSKKEVPARELPKVSLLELDRFEILLDEREEGQVDLQEKLLGIL